ncbi:MAG: ankyrin repeat domain-containing protein [Alphaproteobacteria bacterium]|nr:ankyrin repeat domain-containing protein [Alphaproteobacteria bacterium]
MHPAFNRSSQKPPQGVNAPLDDRGRTALHLAVEKNDEIAVHRLLRIGANINQTDKQGQTPLFEAAAQGHQNMLELLTARGAKIDHRDQQGRSIADWAIEKGADAIFLDILASYGAPFEPALKTRRTPLHRAAEQGRADLIETLVLQGLDLNARDSDGKTPLHLATAHDHLDAMRKLVSLGANPVQRDNDIVTPLHIAAERGHLPALDFLLTLPEVRVGINQHAAYQTGFTPVMVAASKNHTEVIERLAAHGADLNKTDNQNRHSLFIAVEGGQVDAVRKLIALGADAGRDILSTSNKSPMIHWVNEKNYREILGLIVSAGANINAVDANDQTALHRACDYTRREQVLCLLQLGAAPNGLNGYGQRPIDELIDNYSYRNEDMPELIDALLRAGADPGISPSPLVQRAPLHVATEAGHVQSVKLLLKKGAPVDVADRSAQAMTPLLMAAENGNLEIADLLLTRGANILKTDAEKRSALHLAARGGQTDFCTFLLNVTDIDINARDKDGWTPLHHACAREKTAVVKMLIERGADLTAVDNDGLTPLHRAMDTRSDDVIDAYVATLGAKADLDVLSQNGDTPLIHAVRTGFIKSVEKLIAAGADITAQGAEGLTALHAALIADHRDIALTLAEALRTRGLQPDMLCDKDGNTPLHIAARVDSNIVAEKLLDCGAEIDRANADGDTPLHISVRNQHFSMTTLLTERGAKSLIANKSGETPVDIVMQAEQGYLFEMLLPSAIREEAEKTEKPAAQDKKPPAPPKPSSP